MAKEIMFRPADDGIVEWLSGNAKAHNRSVAEEMRAATAIYRDLVELAHLHAVEPTERATEKALADLERRLLDNIGRVLLPALTDIARNQFEDDAGVDYPDDRFGHINVPFDLLLQWIATGEA